MKNFITVLFIFLFFACQEKVNECNNCDEETTKEAVSNEELVMYEPSELATLMLEMYDANLNWKEEILKGNIPKNFPEKYKNMHTAQSVNGSAGGDFYNAMTTSYLSAVENLTNANKENAQERFNKMVNVCVSCHLEICPGPVSKIEKLIIE